MFNNYANNHYQHNGDGNFDINDSFSNLNLNAKFNDFQSRRPSQLVDFHSAPLVILTTTTTTATAITIAIAIAITRTKSKPTTTATTFDKCGQ